MTDVAFSVPRRTAGTKSFPSDRGKSIQDVRVAFRLAGVNPDMLLYGIVVTAIGAVVVLLDRRQKGRSF